jgi:LysM repeat protein/predicted esterase
MRLATLAFTLLIGAWSTVALADKNPPGHTVQPGQTLGRIAKRYGVSVDALCAANALSRNAAIQPGLELVIPEPGDEVRAHIVAPGDTLGKLAERYRISIEDLLAANQLQRTSTLREGQRIAIPTSSGSSSATGTQSSATETQASGRDSEPAATTHHDAEREDREPPAGSGPEVLTVGSSSVYYYRPVGRGRLGMRPVIFYLHGRGGDPKKDCDRWAKVARRWGWLVCPSGPEDRGSGRGWASNWALGHHLVMASLEALRNKFGRRVQLYGNTIVGFSEGAYVAMNVGVREPRAFNRWLILAGTSTYWGGPGMEALDEARRQLKRVFFITGVNDEVMPGTEDALERLRGVRVPTRLAVPEDMGHEVLLESKAGLYREALLWLEEGKGPRPERAASPQQKTALR